MPVTSTQTPVTSALMPVTSTPTSVTSALMPVTSTQTPVTSRYALSLADTVVVSTSGGSPPALTAGVYSHDGPIIRRKHGYILTTDQSYASNTGMFSRRTNPTQATRVYSHDGPIGRRYALSLADTVVVKAGGDPPEVLTAGGAGGVPSAFSDVAYFVKGEEEEEEEEAPEEKPRVITRAPRGHYTLTKPLHH
eukprot:1185186-Prorocentrum_minimum.AAC.2